VTSSTLWSAPEVVSETTTSDRDPAPATAGEVPHLVWSKNSILYHSYRGSAGWSRAAAVTGGTQPVLVAGLDGRLHCVFTNVFAGNSEIYYQIWDGKAWSLPVNVSHTQGVSTDPTLALGSDGVLHAAWSDTTSGYSVIYYGRRVLGTTFWSSGPIPGTRGGLPAIAAGRGGNVYVVWQDRQGDNGPWDIFASTRRNGAWTLPLNLSDSLLKHSIMPSLAATAIGTCHLAWQEEQEGLYGIAYSDLRPNGWSQPEVISAAGQDCRAPAVRCDPQQYVEVFWLEGKSLLHRVRPPQYDAAWWATATINGDWPAPQQAGCAVSGAGRLHVAWLSAALPAPRSIYYVQREPVFNHAAYLPVIKEKPPNLQIPGIVHWLHEKSICDDLHQPGA